MKSKLLIVGWAGALGFFQDCSAAAGVVINEVMYHAPRGFETVQWIELHNSGAESVNLGGWKLSGDVSHTFAPTAALSPGGFLVVAADAKAFQGAYQTEPQATFSGSLGRGGGTIVLAKATGEAVDRLKYNDKDRWPAAADGRSSSLERIWPAGASNPGNWRASPGTAERKLPGGTPGARNAGHSDKPVPEIRRAAVSRSVVAPVDRISVSAEVRAEGGIRSVVARVQKIGFGEPPKEESVELRATTDGIYSAEIQAPSAGKKGGVLRVRIEATGANGAARVSPDPAEIHPAFSVLVRGDEPRGKLDVGSLYSGSGNPVVEGRDQPTPEDQALWGLQQRIRMEANPYALIGALALTNALDPGQLTKFRPILKAAFEQRNQLVTELYETEDFAAVSAATPKRITAWRKSFQDQLNPLLNPEQKALAADWANRTGDSRRRGFDPTQMLSEWINIEQMAFGGIAFTRLDEPGWARARTALLAAIKLRATLVEPVKTAFESNESREKFQESAGKIQASIQESLAKVVPEAELQAVQSVPDATQMFRMRTKKTVAPAGGRILGAFVHTDARTGDVLLYDDVEVTPRKAGWKVHLAEGDQYHGMNSFNLIYEYMDRFVLAEPLAFDLYRRANNGAPATEFLRLNVDGAPQGFHLLVEQPNRRFIARQGLNPDGVLYKIEWRGSTLEETHERKSPGSGHADLRELVDRLNSAKDGAQWKIIQENLDVPQVLTYFAVNSVLGHWDGYMNNYFIYHDTLGSGKWTLYPWDQDKTFGFHDGIRGDEVFTTLPINYGAKGDVPLGWNRPQPPLNFMEVFQRKPEWAWWRQPGPISGPLIANPDCRKHYAARIRSLLDNEFSAVAMSGAIDQLAARLREEVGLRAEVKGEEPAEALRLSKRNVDSLKRFVAGRREYLLAQEEIKRAGPWTPEIWKSAGKP